MSASPAGAGPRSHGVQFGVRGLLGLVLAAAAAFGVARYAWDQRAGNGAQRGLRMQRSGDGSERRAAAADLDFRLLTGSLPKTQVDTIVSALLIALRDREPAVRGASARALLHVAG